MDPELIELSSRLGPHGKVNGGPKVREKPAGKMKREVGNPFLFLICFDHRPGFSD